MGQNNRQRRATKQRQRAQKQRGRSAQPNFTSDFDHEVFAVRAACLMLSRSLRMLTSGHEPTFDMPDFMGCADRHQQAAVDDQFSFTVAGLIKAGWTPLDLYEVVRRKCPGPASIHLLDAVAAATATHPERLVHPQWRAQLDQLGAAVRDTDGRSPSWHWGKRAGLEWSDTFEHLLAVLVVICALPTIERMLPAPGEDTGPASNAGGIDVKVLRRVRGLLAKAESTEHDEEADALTAKAQQLMTRYSIERAVAESSQPVAQRPLARRMWLDNPYVDAKALLVDVVADANNCRAIQSVAWGSSRSSVTRPTSRSSSC